MFPFSVFVCLPSRATYGQKGGRGGRNTAEAARSMNIPATGGTAGSSSSYASGPSSHMGQRGTGRTDARGSLNGDSSYQAFNPTGKPGREPFYTGLQIGDRIIVQVLAYAQRAPRVTLFLRKVMNAAPCVVR